MQLYPGELFYSFSSQNHNYVTRGIIKTQRECTCPLQNHIVQGLGREVTWTSATFLLPATGTVRKAILKIFSGITSNQSIHCSHYSFHHRFQRAWESAFAKTKLPGSEVHSVSEGLRGKSALSCSDGPGSAEKKSAAQVLVQRWS